MLRTVIAVEQDGLDVRVIPLLFDVPSEDFDLKAAVCKAATDFCKTEEGQGIYERNCSWFNWSDFATYVPQEFCEKHGFRKVKPSSPVMEVDLDEDLVDDSQVEPDKGALEGKEDHS